MPHDPCFELAYAKYLESLLGESICLDGVSSRVVKVWIDTGDMELEDGRTLSLADIDI